MILFCKTCRQFFSENRMASEDQCDKCEAKESLDNGRRSHGQLVKSSKEEHGDRRSEGEAINPPPQGKVLPIASGERGSKIKALAGQMTLSV